MGAGALDVADRDNRNRGRRFSGSAQPRLSPSFCTKPPPPSCEAQTTPPLQFDATMAAEIVLPGDEIPPSLLPVPQNSKKPLTLGPGLRHIPPSTITTTIAGSLNADSRKNAIWIERNGGRVRNPSATASHTRDTDSNLSMSRHKTMSSSQPSTTRRPKCTFAR